MWIFLQLIFSATATYFYYCGKWYNADYYLLMWLFILPTIIILIRVLIKHVKTKTPRLFLVITFLLPISIYPLTFVIENRYENFTQREHVAVCQEHQGMVTYNIFLFRDGTFYADMFSERNVYGTYEIKNDILTFEKSYDPFDDICEKYVLDQSKSPATLEPQCSSDNHNNHEVLWYFDL